MLFLRKKSTPTSQKAEPLDRLSEQEHAKILRNQALRSESSPIREIEIEIKGNYDGETKKSVRSEKHTFLLDLNRKREERDDEAESAKTNNNKRRRDPMGQKLKNINK